MKTDEPILTPKQLSEYWSAIESDPLPDPIRKFTAADSCRMGAMYAHSYDEHDMPYLLDRDATGKRYLDLIHQLRVETGEPSALWDCSHLITAGFIEETRALKK